MCIFLPCSPAYCPVMPRTHTRTHVHAQLIIFRLLGRPLGWPAGAIIPNLLSDSAVFNLVPRASVAFPQKASRGPENIIDSDCAWCNRVTSCRFIKENPRLGRILPSAMPMVHKFWSHKSRRIPTQCNGREFLNAELQLLNESEGR